MANTKRQVAAPNTSGTYVRGKTRDGGEIRIYADDAGGEYPLHGAYWYEAEQRWVPAAWTLDGYVVNKETPRSLDVNIRTLKVPKGLK